MKKIYIFGIKSVIVLKKNLISNQSTINFFLKNKIRSYSDEATDFHTVLKKNESYYQQMCCKEYKYIEKGDEIYYWWLEFSSDDFWFFWFSSINLMKSKLKTSVVIGSFFIKGKFMCPKSFKQKIYPIHLSNART